MNNEPKTDILPVVHEAEHRPVKGSVRFGHNILTNVDIDHVLQAMVVTRQLIAASKRQKAQESAHGMSASGSHELHTPVVDPDAFRNPDGSFNKQAFLNHHREVHNN